MTEGKVYLVGAGPGNVDYLTVRSHQLLQQAQVLIYDALVDSQLLQLVPPECHKIDVGKRGGKSSTPQIEINQLLVEHCQLGKQVVRLKSGDPFIFGRCTAEITALKAANCNFEVVPGISSALAAPLLLGIPLTDPVLSRCFAVFTAHEPDELDWESLARIDTLVVLMGGQHLAEIVAQLERHGKSLNTPIAIARWVSSPKQRVWTSDLAHIVAQTKEISLTPVVMIIGEVVKLRTYLQPSPLPLAGKTILITRAMGQSSGFSNLLQQQGATVIEMPAIAIVPPTNWEALDRAIANLLEYDWLILTSANAVEYFFERLANQNKDARAIAGVKIAVVGEKTAQSLKQYGLKPDFIPPEFVADAIARHFPESLKAKKVLFPRVESGGREVLVQQLSAKGAEVVEVAAYQSKCPENFDPIALEALQKGAVDVITFASSKTVKYFHQLLTAAGGANLDRVCIASIGPQTSKTCQQLLEKVDIEATEYTLEGLTKAIVYWADEQ
ncbi:uroporphyrinogen-III C-methyltransferase [Synechocystis sp. PCC 7509]|uniref:uroporphyrinogen-III C-methyltransferase n=1 Tax=Synechocystis sp. PCC 7509 TaxID=927677 RepID=UPI0002ABF0B1|nr:uroporphyrinogen-III C-methyltransferase [Synechocystis sp. PCC 7509]